MTGTIKADPNMIMSNPKITSGRQRPLIGSLGYILTDVWPRDQSLRLGNGQGMPKADSQVLPTILDKFRCIFVDLGTEGLSLPHCDF